MVTFDDIRLLMNDMEIHFGKLRDVKVFIDCVSFDELKEECSIDHRFKDGIFSMMFYHDGQHIPILPVITADRLLEASCRRRNIT